MHVLTTYTKSVFYLYIFEIDYKDERGDFDTQDFIEISIKFQRWMKENFNTDYVAVTRHGRGKDSYIERVTFDNRFDAMIFKMRWSTQ